MVVTNNDITQKNYKKLSIQVSLSGLSFCVFDLLQNSISVLKSVTFQENQVIEEQLWKTFSEFPILSERFDEIKVIHDNNLNTFVPQSLFDENYLGSYLQYNIKVFENDLFAFDSLKVQQINNVYVPYVNINNFLLDQFQTFDYLHVNTVLVDKLLDNSKYIFEKQVFVHVQQKHFEMVVVQNGKLLFFNSFEPSTPEDFIYYILFTLEQLQLNPENCSVELLGTITEDSDFYKIAYKYIRNCSIFKVNSIAEKYSITEKEAKENFILIHS